MDITFSLSFFKNNRTAFTNEEVFEIRREVANMMQRCGYGDRIEADLDKFANTDLTPVDDDYHDDPFVHELFICYLWNDRTNTAAQNPTRSDERLQNILRPDVGIYSLQQIIHHVYPNVEIVARIIYS